MKKVLFCCLWKAFSSLHWQKGFAIHPGKKGKGRGICTQSAAFILSSRNLGTKQPFSPFQCPDQSRHLQVSVIVSQQRQGHKVSQ